MTSGVCLLLNHGKLTLDSFAQRGYEAATSKDTCTNILKANSVLRWSGSKAKLVPNLLQLAPPVYSGYVEPFAGSAQLFFAIGPSRAVLGDFNGHVIDVYRAIALGPSAVSDALESIPQDADAYYKLRALAPADLPLPQRAARLIFLMKACFNGVYRTNRQGRFNVPMGTRVYALPSRADLRNVSAALQNVLLVHGDFSETLEHTVEGDWIYLDPPYRQQGRFRGEYGYDAAFEPNALNKLVRCAERLVRKGRHVMLSYVYDADLISRLPGWSVHKIRTVRTVASAAGARREIEEVVITSYRT